MQNTVQFKDVSLYTESFGDMKKPTILLIMGSASSLIWWDEVFCQKLVDKGFFVIRYDNRDTGKSTSYPVGKPGYTFEEMSDDAIQVLDAYHIEKAVIMGMSMGGMLAQMIAVRHPERVSGLVLHATMYFAEGAEKRAGRIAAVRGQARFTTSLRRIPWCPRRIGRFPVPTRANRRLRFHG